MKKSCLAACIVLAAFVALAKTSTPEGWLDDYDAALKKAAAEEKHIIVDFSGSDWCIWCKRLDKEVFDTDVFRKAAAEKYVLLMVDSPSKKSLLSPKAAKENPKLVEKFGVKGFPTVVVLNPKGEEVCRLGYEKGGPEKYLETLDAAIREAPDLKKYIKPIEDVLNRHDREMAEETRAAMKKVEEKFPRPDKDMPKDEMKKLAREAGKYAREIIFEEVYAKYVPLYEKAFAEAKAMKVPEHMEAKKKELIDGQERIFNMLKDGLHEYEEAKKNGTLDELDEELEEEDDEVERLPRRTAPTFKVPRPADAKLETAYWTDIAMPFYERHIVKTFVPKKGVSGGEVKKIRIVRAALARYLATGRYEFPTGLEYKTASELWAGKCRDAAVAIVHYVGLDGDVQYWKGASIFTQAIEKHDFKAEPVLGFILRAFALKAARYHYKRNHDEPVKPIHDATDALNESFGAVKDIYKSADRRILERFSQIVALPDGVEEAFGDEYLKLCQNAGVQMDQAYAARGSGWAKDVTEEGWKGWDEGNRAAESNLLAAVALRPEESRAQMALASLAGRSCCTSGDSLSWCLAAVSNSLDLAAENVERFLHFQTSRWGGSTRFLMDVVMECATNVDVRSTFSYRTAAEALAKVLVAETDGMTQKGVFAKVVTPDVAAALYGMFEAYVAAPKSKFMPSSDVFRGMGMCLALQLQDWKEVRRWWKSLERPLCGYSDALWLKHTFSPATDGIFLRYIFDILCNSPKAEQFIAAEEAAAEGRIEDAYKIYSELMKAQKPLEAEKYVASGRYFNLRRLVQEKAGGWVDVMPTRFGGEANHWWSLVLAGADGKARLEKRGAKGYYRLSTALPGIGVEYEATVHFEKGDKKQKDWNIGWGFGRPYSGYCVDNSSWSYPYIAFSRDEKGDHYAVETFTDENRESARSNKKMDGESESEWEARKAKIKAGGKIGRSPMQVVAEGDLKRGDLHAFKVKTAGGRLEITIDGNTVYGAELDEMMEVEEMRDRIQPNGDILPVWKLFKNTAFSGYRYRRIPETAKEE